MSLELLLGLQKTLVNMSDYLNFEVAHQALSLSTVACNSVAIKKLLLTGVSSTMLQNNALHALPILLRDVARAQC